MTQPTDPAPRLFCFGLGYSALALARGLLAEDWQVAGTTRGTDKGLALAAIAYAADLARERVVPVPTHP